MRNSIDFAYFASFQKFQENEVKMVRNMKILNVFAALSVLTLVQTGYCADAGQTGQAGMDPASSEALVRTQAMLRDPQQRAKATSETPQAQFVDKQTQSLAGTPENANAIYDLSADIMESLALKTNGDPAKMKEILDQAKNDPKAFAEKLTPEQRKKLQEISQKIPVNGSGSATHAKP
jgi:hypothetical protein